MILPGGKRRRRTELILVLLAGVIVAASAYLIADKMPPELYRPEYMNSWFGGDINRVYENMTERGSNHYRTKVHPLFSLIFCPLVYFFNRFLFHFSRYATVRLLLGAGVFAWVVIFYAAVRMITGRVADSILYTVLALVSASTIFWFFLPETFLFGSVTILIVLAFGIYFNQNPPADFWYIIIGIISLSMTITNWIAGIIVTFSQKNIRRAFRITIYVFAFSTLLWSVQKYFFPSAEFFLGDREETRYIGAGSVIDKGKTFFIHSMVIPDVDKDINKEGYAAVRIDPEIPDTALWTSAAVLWLILFGGGLYYMIRAANRPGPCTIILLILAAQMLLHLLYGSEAFIYSLHYIPILVLVASFMARTRYRVPAAIITAILIIMLSVNNFSKFARSVSIISKPAEEKIPSELYDGGSDESPR